MFLGTFLMVFHTMYSVYHSQYYLSKYMEVDSFPQPYPSHRKEIEAKIFCIENALRAARSKLDNYEEAAGELQDYTDAIGDIMFDLGFEPEFDDFEFEPDAIGPPAKLARSDNNNGGGLVDSMEGVQGS